MPIGIKIDTKKLNKDLLKAQKIFKKSKKDLIKSVGLTEASIYAILRTGSITYKSIKKIEEGTGIRIEIL